MADEPESFGELTPVGSIPEDLQCRTVRVNRVFSDELTPSPSLYLFGKMLLAFGFPTLLLNLSLLFKALLVLDFTPPLIFLFQLLLSTLGCELAHLLHALVLSGRISHGYAAP
ncbi:hypothetical protein [Candidatus Corynebacterium faecigallinarum]|uniref:hypothetical protein n=1 Tax=Candidatus Corynebacterium faecigallinarum TaxID=2838528 RepID=UPI003FD58947